MACVLLGFVVVLVSVAACGGSDIGQSCDEEGKVMGECVDGAVCGHQKNMTEGDLVCLKQCTQPGDCGSNEECNSVGSTSLRACRGK